MHFLFEFDNEQITYTLLKHNLGQQKMANAVSIIADIISCKWGLLGHFQVQEPVSMVIGSYSGMLMNNEYTLDIWIFRWIQENG